MPSAMKVNYSGEGVSRILASDDEREDSSSVEIKNGQVLSLPKGEHFIIVEPVQDIQKEFTFYVEMEPNDFGQVKVAWAGGKNSAKVNSKKDYTLTYTPGKNFGETNNANARYFPVNSNGGDVGKIFPFPLAVYPKDAEFYIDGGTKNTGSLQKGKRS